MESYIDDLDVLQILKTVSDKYTKTNITFVEKHYKSEDMGKTISKNVDEAFRRAKEKHIKNKI